MQFVDPKNDVAFKKIFGSEEHKGILISFLNAVLDYTGEAEIEYIEIINPFQKPIVPGFKDTILDVHARDKSGKTFIVEMQIRHQKFFEKRALYYSAKAYAGQIDKGEDYAKLEPVIFVGIMDFSKFENNHYISRHKILNVETGEQEIRDIEFNFVELPKFNKTEAELQSVVEKWVYFIKNADNLTMVPSNTEKPIREAYDVAERQSWSKAEYEIYDYWSMRKQDERGRVEFAHDEGLAKGIEQGIEQGIQKGIEKIVLNMHKKGVSIEQIAETIDLPIDKVKKIIG